MIDLSVQFLSNARIVHHLVTRFSYLPVLFSSLLEALNRAVIPNDHDSAFVLPSVVCFMKSMSMSPESRVRTLSDGSSVSMAAPARVPDSRLALAIAISDRIAEIQSGRHVCVPDSYYACRREIPSKAFAIPLTFGDMLDSTVFPRSPSAGGFVLTQELSSYIKDLKESTAALQRNFGGISHFARTGGFPIPGTLRVDQIFVDTEPAKKRLYVIMTDLSNIFFHHDAVAVFLEDAKAFDMFLNVAKLMQFADGQIMFVHKHIEFAGEEKWIRLEMSCEQEHFSNTMMRFTSALAPSHVFVHGNGADSDQSPASSALPPDRQISIVFSCLRRVIIFLLQYLTAAIQRDSTFAIPMWLKHTNQLLEHFDPRQFVTCCIFHPVSFHLPIHRALSFFLALLSVHKRTISGHSPVRELLNPSFAALAMQHPLCLLTAV